MALRLGAYTACLHDRPLEAALEVLGSNGLTSVEVNTGGFIPSPHCHVDLLLSSAQARRDYLEVFASRGMELTGLNCNGNPLNPLPGVGPKHADDLRRTIELAGLLGVPNVVTMSGTPGSDPDAKYPSWVVNPWDGVYLDVLDYQWDVAAGFQSHDDFRAAGTVADPEYFTRLQQAGMVRAAHPAEGQWEDVTEQYVRERSLTSGAGAS